MTVDGFGSFEEDDDDDEMVVMLLPDEAVEGVDRLHHQIGEEDYPDWFIEGIEHGHLIQGEAHVDVLVRGRYIRAHHGDYVIRLDTTYTIDTPKEVQ